MLFRLYAFELITCLRSSTQIPKFDFVSNAKPALFAYPPPTKLPEKQQAEKVQTAVLSTTAKSTARAKEKEKERNAEGGMQTVSSPFDAPPRRASN